MSDGLSVDSKFGLKATAAKAIHHGPHAVFVGAGADVALQVCLVEVAVFVGGRASQFDQ